LQTWHATNVSHVTDYNPTFCSIQPLLILCQLLFQVNPKVFNETKVWRLSRPDHNSVFMIFRPFGGLFGLVFGIIILLKDNVSYFLAI